MEENQDISDEAYELERKKLLLELETYKVPTKEDVLGKSSIFQDQPFVNGIVVKEQNTQMPRISLQDILNKKQANIPPVETTSPIIEQTANSIETLAETKPVIEQPITIIEKPTPVIEKAKERFKNLDRGYAPRFLVALDDLPSEGKFYPANTKIIACEYLTVELDLISLEIATLPIKELYSLMLEGIIVKGMAKELLTVEDFHYISKLRKIKTLGDANKPYKKQCPDCGNVNTFAYPLSTGFPTKKLTIDGVFKQEFSFCYIDDSTDLGIREETRVLEFSPVTIGSLLKAYDLNIPLTEISYMLFSCVSEDPKQLIENEFSQNRLTDKNLNLLTTVFALLDHGFLPKSERCRGFIEGGTLDRKSQCQTIITFDVDDDFDLVLPFRSE